MAITVTALKECLSVGLIICRIIEPARLMFFRHTVTLNVTKMCPRRAETFAVLRACQFDDPRLDW